LPIERLRSVTPVPAYLDPHETNSVPFAWSPIIIIINLLSCSYHLHLATRSQSEYSALSMASRVAMAIPLLEVIHYIIQSFYISSQLMKRFNTTLHEDNQGALNMA
jgi:hypothetical protein